MKKHASKLGLIGTGVALITLLGATASALPSAASGSSHAATMDMSQTTTSTSQATTGSSQAATHRTQAQLRLCQTREKVIDKIMTRIETRANNQATLFSGIATRVEAFYVKKGNTSSNYTTLVSAVTAAETQEQNDFGMLQTSSSFTCSASDPKAIVTGFQSYLKMEITDLQNLRTAVKNLIVGVAQANGSKLANTSTTTTSTGSGQ